MIETAEETITTCQRCGAPIEQKPGRGHRSRLYCDDRGKCRQRAHRARKQVQAQDTANVTPNVTNGDLQQRIAQLEQDLAAAHHLIDEYINRKKTSQPWKKSLQERWAQLGKAADHPALTIPIRVPAGERAYRVFGLAASNELLEEGNVTLRRQLEE